MDTENHNDSSNQREIRNNTVEAMDTEEGKLLWDCQKCYLSVFMCPNSVEVATSERKKKNSNSNCWNAEWIPLPSGLYLMLPSNYIYSAPKMKRLKMYDLDVKRDSMQ